MVSQKVYADSEELGSRKPIHGGYSSTPSRMLVIPEKHSSGKGAETALMLRNSTGAVCVMTSHTPVLVRLWWRTSADENVVFCASALEKELPKKNLWTGIGP